MAWVETLSQKNMKLLVCKWLFRSKSPGWPPAWAPVPAFPAWAAGPVFRACVQMFFSALTFQSFVSLCRVKGDCVPFRASIPPDCKICAYACLGTAGRAPWWAHSLRLCWGLRLKFQNIRNTKRASLSEISQMQACAYLFYVDSSPIGV